MKRVNGFTLTEVMVTLAIIAFMVAIAVPAINKIMAQGRLTVARQQVKSIQGALDAWITGTPSVSAARTAFNTTSTASDPANHLTFFTTNLASIVGPDSAADFTANSTSTQLRSSALTTAGCYITITWPPGGSLKANLNP